MPQPGAPSSAPGGSSASSHCQPPRDLILVCVETKGRLLYLSRAMVSFREARCVSGTQPWAPQLTLASLGFAFRWHGGSNADTVRLLQAAIWWFFNLIQRWA